MNTLESDLSCKHGCRWAETAREPFRDSSRTL